MPIEITELIIRAKVDASESASQNGSNSAARQTGTAETETLEKAVAEVLDLLKRQKER